MLFKMISNGLYLVGVFGGWFVGFGVFLRCFKGNTKLMRKIFLFMYLVYMCINIYWLDKAVYKPSQACMCFVETCLKPLLIVTSLALEKTPNIQHLFFFLSFP